jgi:hypothetical protein
MSAPSTAEQQLQQYLQRLFPTRPAATWLVVSWQTRYFQSRWFPVAQAKEVRPFILQTAPRHDVYVGLGLRTHQTVGRGSSADVDAIGGVWIEVDHAGGHHKAPNLPSREQLLQFLAALPFTCSMIVDSSGGFHCYLLFKELWQFENAEERDQAQALLRRFQRTVQHWAAEAGWHIDTTADLARVLRPPGTFNHKSGTPQPVTLYAVTDVRYDPAELEDASWMLAAEAHDTNAPPPDPDTPSAQLDPIVAGCAWVRHCQEDAATLPEPEWYAMLGIVGRCEDGTQHAQTWSQPYPGYDRQETARKLAHALDHGPRTCASIRTDLDAAAYCDACQHWGTLTSPIGLGYGRQARDRNGTSPPAEPAPPPPWPTLDDAAYYGLAGKIVRTIAPNTEGDPVAVLVQFLVMFGNVIGRYPYYVVEADRHYSNLFACFVGRSSRGRKGTSAGYPHRLVREADHAWGPRVLGGLSSGEGVIWQVRDPITTLNKDGEEVTKDKGSDDKRLLILETEFARALAKMAQEGNVLSAILRQAYDHGGLRTLVSGRTHAPVTATDAHVSLIAHITLDELQRLLSEAEAANGFANRFLWACTKRAQLLPEGGGYPEQALAPYTRQVDAALHTARSIGRMTRDEAARVWWKRTYPKLTEERAGLFGAITARAEAHVLRLSMVYALLDQTATITPEHLDAAHAVWRYCDASARYIFGELLGDPLADELLRLLRMAGSQGMTRTDLSNALGRNVPSARIGQALGRLQRDQLVGCQITNTSGRPVERWSVNNTTPTN